MEGAGDGERCKAGGCRREGVGEEEGKGGGRIVGEVVEGERL